MSRFLLENDAQPNVVNYNGASALLFAATFGQYEVANMLIEKGLIRISKTIEVLLP